MLEKQAVDQQFLSPDLRKVNIERDT